MFDWRFERQKHEMSQQSLLAWRAAIRPSEADAALCAVSQSEKSTKGSQKPLDESKSEVGTYTPKETQQRPLADSLTV